MVLDGFWDGRKKEFLLFCYETLKFDLNTAKGIKSQRILKGHWSARWKPDLFVWPITVFHKEVKAYSKFQWRTNPYVENNGGWLVLMKNSDVPMSSSDFIEDSGLLLCTQAAIPSFLEKLSRVRQINQPISRTAKVVCHRTKQKSRAQMFSLCVKRNYLRTIRPVGGQM